MLTSKWIGRCFWLLIGMGMIWIMLEAQNPGLMADDSGEMAAAAYGLGLPHPPGYPLFDLLGRLVCMLFPVGTIAFRLNCFSEVLAILSAILVLDTCRKLIDTEKNIRITWNNVLTELLLLFAVFVLVFNRTFFSQCLTVKGGVYTLTLLCGSFLVWLKVAGNRDGKPNSTAYLVGFIWALAMAHHWQTAVLWTPFVFWWMLGTIRTDYLKKSILVFCFCLVGFSPYLYLPIRTVLHCSPCWGHPVDLQGFYWVVSRQLVKNVETWVNPWSFYLLTIKEFFRIGLWDWIPGFIFLFFLGLGFLWIRRKELFWFLILFFVPVVIGVLLIHETQNLYLLHVYLLSITGVLVVGVFYGLYQSLKWFESVVAKTILCFFLITSSAFWASHVVKLEDKSRYSLAEDFGNNVLKQLPSHTTLLSDGDHYVMSLWYLQYVQGKRPDVHFEPSVFLTHDWGWMEFKAKADVSPPQNIYLSLGHLSLEESLFKEKLPWIPCGLVEARLQFLPPPGTLCAQIDHVSDILRQRGWGIDLERKNVDFSSSEILQYYGDQHFEAARFLESHGYWDYALTQWAKGLTWAREPAEVYANMAVIAGKEGYERLSEKLSLLGVASNPSDLSNYLNAGSACLDEGLKDEALEWYQKALELHQDDPLVQSYIDSTESKSACSIPMSVALSEKGYKRLKELFLNQKLAWLAQLVSLN